MHEIPEVVITPTRRGLLITLPAVQREFPGIKRILIAIVAVLGGLVLAGWGLAGIMRLVNTSPGGWGLAGGAAAIGFGWPELVTCIFMLAGARQLIGADQRRIVVTQRVWLIRRRWKIPIRQLNRLALIEPEEPDEDHAFLFALSWVQGYVQLATNVSREPLERVAKALADHANKVLAADPAVKHRHVVRVVESDADGDLEGMLEQPPTSDATVEHSEDGLTITLKPFRRPGGIYVPSWIGLPLLLLLPMALAATVLLFIMDNAVLAYVVIVGWIVILVMTFWAARRIMQRRTAIIDISQNVLLITAATFWRTHQYSWRAKEIADIDVSTDKHDSDTLVLKIESKTSRDRNLFPGRDEAELRWLAAVLRHHLITSETR